MSREISVSISFGDWIQSEGVEVVDEYYTEMHKVVRFRAVSDNARILVWSSRMVFDGKRVRAMTLIVEAYEFDGERWKRVI